MRTTLAEIIEEYEPERSNSEVNRFRKMPSLEDAIRAAAESKREDGRYYPHQRRNVGWRNAIPKGTKILVNAYDQFQTCSKFDEVHELTKELLADTRGLGPLYCFDVALRIGAYLELLPEKVYLHTGSLEGAKRLEDDGELPEGATKKGFLEMFELPRYLRKFEPYQVEDILCHYANCRRTRRSSKNNTIP
jgi:hypothetical protein